MSVNFLISQAKNIQIVIDENASEIEALDQNIGDGDHIFNVQRGLKLVVELEDTIKDLPIDKALKHDCNESFIRYWWFIGGSIWNLLHVYGQNL
tara:strand:- start:268 stop:549 length:282 start_codon:yes stop_codon:yes gene_type:complete